MKTRLPNLITVLILTLITTLMWIGLSVYRAITVKPDPSVPKEVTEKLDPNLDAGTIEAIKSRLFLSDEQIPETQIQASPTPTSPPSPTPSASPTPAESSTSTPLASPTP